MITSTQQCSINKSPTFQSEHYLILDNCCKPFC